MSQAHLHLSPEAIYPFDARGAAKRFRHAAMLAGHSCPTVAGAWLMTRTALSRLYPDGMPQRGGLRVELRQAIDEGVAGVIASVAGLITGAANDGGFKGLAGRFGGRACCDLAWPWRARSASRGWTTARRSNWRTFHSRWPGPTGWLN